MNAQTPLVQHVADSRRAPRPRDGRNYRRLLLQGGQIFLKCRVQALVEFAHYIWPRLLI
jgi:hypothetical protein